MQAIELTPEQLETALRMAHAGKSLQQIHTELGVSAQYFWEYRRKHPEYNENFSQARDEGYDVLADGLVGITERIPDVQRARLESENMRWLLARRKSRVYGDKLDLTVQHTIDIAAALTEGKRRAAFERPVQTLELPQRGELINELQRAATGAEPVASEVGADSATISRRVRALTAPETALDGPITRRDTPPATLGAPPASERVAGPLNAKTATVSTSPQTHCGLTSTDDPHDIFS